MKSWIIVLLTVVASLVGLSSCNDESDRILVAPVPETFLLYDGGCLDTIVAIGINNEFEPSKHNFYPESLSKTSIRLYSLILPRNDEGLRIPCSHLEYYGQNVIYHFGNVYSNPCSGIGTGAANVWELPEGATFMKIIEDKSKFIKEGMKAAGYGNDYGVVGTYPEHFYTAYINGDVVFSSDKPLFGKAAGENLLNYFEVISSTHNIAVGQNNPVLAGGFIPHSRWFDAQDMMKSESWISTSYQFRFKETPPQNYDEITFYISIPVTREHLYDRAKAEYYGLDDYTDFDRKVLTTQCIVRFDR